MAEASTIARPYAQAVFDLANETGKLQGWSEFLAELASAANDDLIRKLISNPNIASEQLTDLLNSICANKLDQDGKNFLNVLAENGRLDVIAEISIIFEDLKSEADKIVKAEVITAFKLNAEQKTSLESALKKRLGCKIEITSRVDKSLIGGAIIRAGDMIIDGSVTAQLDRLSSELAH